MRTPHGAPEQAREPGLPRARCGRDASDARATRGEPLTHAHTLLCCTHVPLLHRNAARAAHTAWSQGRIRAAPGGPTHMGAACAGRARTGPAAWCKAGPVQAVTWPGWQAGGRLAGAGPGVLDRSACRPSLLARRCLTAGRCPWSTRHGRVTQPGDTALRTTPRTASTSCCLAAVCVKHYAIFPRFLRSTVLMRIV